MPRGIQSAQPPWSDDVVRQASTGDAPNDPIGTAPDGVVTLIGSPQPLNVTDADSFFLSTVRFAVYNTGSERPFASTYSRTGIVTFLVEPLGIPEANPPMVMTRRPDFSDNPWRLKGLEIGDWSNAEDVVNPEATAENSVSLGLSDTH